MFRRFFGLLAITILLSTMLMACGDSATTGSSSTKPTAAVPVAPVVPSYTGATEVAIPSAFTPYVQGFSTGFKDGGSTKAYKTTDSVDKVKSGLDDGFKKNGWDDKTNPGDSDKMAVNTGPGTFLIKFQKDDSGTIVLGVPGSDPMRAAGFDVKDGETIFTVISGKAK